MLVHPQFDPVAFSVGPIAVRWYGLMYLAAFALFVILGKYRAKQQLLTGWHPRDIDDMLFYGVFGVILGGRLGYVLFYKPLHYLANPLDIFYTPRYTGASDHRYRAYVKLATPDARKHPETRRAIAAVRKLMRTGR